MRSPLRGLGALGSQAVRYSAIQGLPGQNSREKLGEQLSLREEKTTHKATDGPVGGALASKAWVP